MSSIEDLKNQFQAAHAAVEAYSTAVTEKYRTELPAPVDAAGNALPVPDELLVERARAWTEAESAELDRLRSIARELAIELHRARQPAPGHLHGD